MLFAQAIERNLKMRTQSMLALAAVVAILISSSVALAADKAAADEKSLRDMDAAWSHAAETKDIDKTVSYYADDATFLPSNAPVVHGKDGIRAAWAQFMATPGYSLQFTPAKIVVSKSGDMAYDIGTFQSASNDAQGQPQTSVGKYVVVWVKQGGQWKVAADTFNLDK